MMLRMDHHSTHYVYSEDQLHVAVYYYMCMNVLMVVSV